MRALVYHGRNDIRLEEIPVPEIGPGEAKIRVTNTSICATDIEEWKYGPTYITFTPTVMGHEVAGRVVEIAPDASGLVVGVNMISDVIGFLAYGAALAPDGKCKTFDAAANGLGRGDCCGSLVLRAAVQDTNFNLRVRDLLPATGGDGKRKRRRRAFGLELTNARRAPARP